MVAYGLAAAGAVVAISATAIPVITVAAAAMTAAAGSYSFAKLIKCAWTERQYERSEDQLIFDDIKRSMSPYEKMAHVFKPSVARHKTELIMNELQKERREIGVWLRDNALHSEPSPNRFLASPAARSPVADVEISELRSKINLIAARLANAELAPHAQHTQRSDQEDVQYERVRG